MAKVEIFVDGVRVEAEEGQDVLRAALAAGIYIPHICSHPDLESRGGCKLCVINIEGKEGAQLSCKTIVEPGMKISTKGARLEQIRRVAMEFMLAGHPHDCTSCKMYGKCEFQAMMQETNSVHGRMRDITKTTTFINTKNPLIVREMERCISCGRCIRACKDVRGVGILQLNKKEETYEVYVGTEGDKPLVEADCQFCGACVEVCPTGALQDMEGVFRTDIPKAQALIPCQAECPAHIDIPEYIRLVKEGKNAEAVAVIREKVPFPHALGLVCVHTCESKCKRSSLNDPLSIRNLKRYACEHDDKQIWKEKSLVKAATGKKVAVIGAGPTGMTSAFYLAKQGHDVTVFERNEKAGGYMQYGIPSYRLPREVVDSEVSAILEHGVKLETGKKIENALELKKDYDAVVLAVGTQAGKDAVIKGGDQCDKHTTAVEFLHKISAGESDPNVHEGAKIIVLGGGNVAFDAARTSAKLGAKVSLFCLEQRKDMLADDEEIEQAQEEGVEVHDGTTNLEIIGSKDKLEGLRYANITGFHFGPNGLEVDREDDVDHIEPGDYIIFAMGQKTDLTADFGIALNRFGFPEMKEGHETVQEGIFAAGDCITGTKSVILGIQGGRETASAVDIYLGGDGNIEEVLLERGPADPKIGKNEGMNRIPREELTVESIDKRSRSFTPVDFGFTPEQSGCEASRCLQCDLRCQINRVKMWTEY